MMKQYKEPKLGFLTLDAADVIAVSIEIKDNDKEEGGDKWGPIQTKSTWGPFD